MKPIKIGFVLLSNARNQMPSTRIAALNMFPFLRAAHFDPHIVFEPERDTETPDLTGLATRWIGEKFDIVMFQKVHGPSVQNAASQLAAAGIKTVYGVCDLIRPEMAEATHATIAVTDYLRSLYPPDLQHKIYVVQDGIEHPDRCKTRFSQHRGSRDQPLRAVLVTSAELDHIPVFPLIPDWLEVHIVGRYPAAGELRQRFRQFRWKWLGQDSTRNRIAYLRFLANRRIRRVAWNADDVYDVMQRADIGILPIDSPSPSGALDPVPAWKIKSENRLTMKMCVGLPVIATPIPSYEPIISQGNNGFLATTWPQWIECLELLRDPASRQAIGARARQSVLARYSQQDQARRLIDILHSLVPAPASRPTGKPLDQP